MTQKSTRKCSICNSKKKKILYSQKFASYSNGGLLKGYEVVVCQSCGFCFADNVPDQKVFDIYYREMSKYEAENRDSKPTKYDLAKFSVKKIRLLQHIVAGLLLLEILRDFLRSILILKIMSYF